MKSPRLDWRGIGFALLLAIRAGAAEYYVATDGSNSNDGLSLETPLATLQKALTKAGGGDTIYLRGGTYRGQTIVAQGGGTAEANLQITAYPGETPILKGSVVVTDWVLHDGAKNIWKKAEWAIYSQQVFCNDRILQQIGIPGPNYSTTQYVPVGSGVSSMYPGTFYYDGDARILYVCPRNGADPNLSTMEVSTSYSILTLNIPYVHVSGLTMRHCASSQGGPGNSGVSIGPDSIIEKCDIQWCDFQGLGMWDRSQAIDCIISNHGDVGIGGGKDLVIRRCVINWNNYRRFNSGWHAGGMKFVNGACATVEECDVSNNYGQGIWFDWCKSGSKITIRNNFVSNNIIGIMLEGSSLADVYNNQVKNSGQVGILVSGSDNVWCCHNTIVGSKGFSGIELSGVPRPSCTLTNNVVLNNIIFGSTGKRDLLIPLDNGTDTVGNVSDYNCFYRVDGSTVLASNGQTYPSLESWRQATGFDNHSIQRSPQFNLVTPEDYSTKTDSPVVDAGLTLEAVTEDIRGLPRPQGVASDIGAYETDWRDAQAPAAPQNLSLIATSWNSFHLEWSASFDNVGVAYYEIYRNGARYAVVTQTAFDDANLPPLTTFQYQVVAIDQSGLISAMSEPISGTTGKPPDTESPTAPLKVCALAISKNSISVSWQASTDNVGVVKYNIYRNDSKIAETSSTSFIDGGLKPKTTYNYKVSAEDAAGNASALSKAKPVKTLP